MDRRFRPLPTPITKRETTQPIQQHENFQRYYSIHNSSSKSVIPKAKRQIISTIISEELFRRLFIHINLGRSANPYLSQRNTDSDFHIYSSLSDWFMLSRPGGSKQKHQQLVRFR